MANVMQEFYNRYPYPLTAVKHHRNLNGAVLFKMLNYELRTNNYAQKRILDAGCGTGHRILDVARAFPETSILAFDLANNSIALARQQAAMDRVNNVQFETHDILDYESDEQFDIVVASGVIHHLLDPVRGLQNLTRCLKPDGFFVAFLLHTYGEYDKMLQRETLLTLLADQRHNFNAGVELMRDMGFSISQTRYGDSYGDDLTDQEALCKDVDSLLNPQESTYTFDEAIALLGATPLDWIAIDRVLAERRAAILALDAVRRPVWALDVAKLLGSQQAYAYYLKLNKRQRLHVIELVMRPTGFVILAGHDDSIALKAHRVRGNRVSLKE